MWGNKQYNCFWNSHKGRCDFCGTDKDIVGLSITRFPVYKEEYTCYECFLKYIKSEWEMWELFLDGWVTHA